MSIVAMSDFSTFSQMTYVALSVYVSEATPWITKLVLVKVHQNHDVLGEKGTYRDAVGVLLSNALSLRLTLLERVLVFELGTHRVVRRCVGGAFCKLVLLEPMNRSCTGCRRDR